MHHLDALLEQNRLWAERMERERPGFFAMLAAQQRPTYLWIGCSDSRVPANQIIGLPPGEVFVHRNVGNLVVHSDLNSLSVIEFATVVLGVREIIVCGHYGCGGVVAALQPSQGRIYDHWIRHLRDIARTHQEELAVLDDPRARADRLAELNVETQVRNVRESPVLQALEARGEEVNVNGWIYDVHDGLIRDLTR
ncbi:MAG: carbonic anhydrase [Phycisphaerales bacterium]